MSTLSVLYAIYAGALLVGGAMGYVKAKSVRPLVQGVAAAALVLVALLLFHRHHAELGLLLGMFISVSLRLFFTRRYAVSNRIMLGSPIVLLSQIVFFCSFLMLFHK